jgi:pimeloyl-ACP methyl ester carboxylesterase
MTARLFPNSQWRRLAAALVGVAVLGGCGQGARSADKPDRLVTLPDGRELNLRCTGSGTPTVLLESGYGAGAFAWGKVQPRLSRTTRVCAYDRASYGFSPPGPIPRDGAAIARDIDAALDAAGESGPFVLVGHSAGGLYVRLLAARRPNEVAGLVLVDPSVEQIVPSALDGLNGIRRRLARCRGAAEANTPPPNDDPAWAACGAGARRDALVWDNRLSELDSIFSRTSMQVGRLGELLADVPLYVLTASDTAQAAPTIGLDKPQSVLELQHLRIALSSRRGFQRTVLSSHLLMNDRPEVVTEAVLAMVEATRSKTKPPPLSPSETTAGPDAPAFPDAPR